MFRVLAILFLTACATTPMGKRADARGPAQVEGVCYNAISGKPYSGAECDALVCRAQDPTTGKMFEGMQLHFEGGYGPCIRPLSQGERTNEHPCDFNNITLESRSRPVEAFSSPVCAEAKREFRQCVNGVMLGSYRYAECH